MSSSPYPNELNDRVHFKLNAASRHLDNLRRLEADSPERNLEKSNDRMQVEMEIEEFLYHLVGVKDALLQEINSELQLGLAPELVIIDTINNELNQKKGVQVAKDIMTEIRSMLSDNQNALWLANQLHNLSKHRRLIGRGIVAAGTEISKAPLIEPRTGQGMTIPIMDFLDGSYKEMEKLQKTVRDKISQYRHP